MTEFKPQSMNSAKRSCQVNYRPTRPFTYEGYRWRYYSLQYLAIIYNGHYCSGLFSGKTEKMAAGCDDFWVIFGIFSQVCYPSLHNNGK